MPLIVKPIGDADFLNKRIPVSNAQKKIYSDITPIVDTGSTMKKGHCAGNAHQNSMNEGKYTRISASEFLLFLLEADEVFAEKYQSPPYILIDVRSSIESTSSETVVGAPQNPKGEDSGTTNPLPSTTLPGSIDYPLRRLNHSTSPFPSPIYNVIRNPKGVVLAYDAREEVLEGPLNGANRLAEKGVDRLLILSKGFENLKEKFGDVLELWGTKGSEDALTLLRLKVKHYQVERESRAGSHCTSSRVGSTVQSVQSGATTRKTKGLSSSLARTTISSNSRERDSGTPAWK